MAPNAAYRHFANRDDLLVPCVPLAVAAAARSMEAELAPGARHRHAPPSGPMPGARWCGLPGSVHRRDGALCTASGGRFTVQQTPDPAMEAPRGSTLPAPLSAALDDLATAGALLPARRPGAEYLAWSTVHGMALLAIDRALRWHAPADAGPAGPAPAGHGGTGLSARARRVHLGEPSGTGFDDPMGPVAPTNNALPLFNS